MTMRRGVLAAAGTFLVGIILGGLLFGRGGAPAPGEDPAAGAAAAATVWTCSMHPQIRLPAPGKCPICFMDLIPQTAGEEVAAGHGLVMSEEAMRLAEVETARVARRFVEGEVRTVGKVAVDERRLRTLTAWTGGRLDRLFVEYTGVPVRAGEHLAEIYSPELYGAQAELVEAVRGERDLAAASPSMRETAAATTAAARSRLRLLGLKDDQIAAIEAQGAPSERLTLYAPVGGIVVEKLAVQGDYVETGTPLYRIAELTSVWVLLDVYESDLVWVHQGATVAFEVEAFPGEMFEGRISFIDPLVNPATRTVKVRVNAENPRLRLKPDMFVRATIRTKFAGDGRTLAPGLAGKWMCPMHPEVVRDAAGACEVCGMPLERASALGFVTDAAGAEPPLVIPATAALQTGRRAVVYVRVPGAPKPTFEGREVVLGPRAGVYVVVTSGLAEGEEVVVKGAFKIDSALQIQARPSMMSPASSPGASPAASAEARARVAPLYVAYFAVHAALAGDDFAAAREAVAGLDAALAAATAAGLDGADRGAVEGGLAAVRTTTRTALAAAEMAALRSAFSAMSDAFIALERTVGPPDGATHRLVFCPMAFDNRGAFWLQDRDGVLNPYYGASMLRCGSVKETFTGSR